MPSSSQHQGLSIELTLTPEPASTTLWLQGFEGREEISEPFQYAVYLTASKALDLDKVIGSKVKLSVQVETGKVVVHGLVLGVRGYDPPPENASMGAHSYALDIRSGLTGLALHRQNRILGPDAPVKTADVIAKVLAGLQEATRGNPITLDQTVDLKAGADYKDRNFVVQHDESDLAFLSRQCEASGVFFFFKHEDSGELVFFGDDNISFPEIKGTGAQNPKVPYRSQTEGSVLQFGFTALSRPAKVSLKDYDPARPTQPPSSSADVAKGLHGIFHRFGALVGGPLTPERAAKVRAEELACRRMVFRGRSNHAPLRAGTVFELTSHPNSAFNQRYLIISVEHRAAAPAPTGYASPIPPRSYENNFECIPVSVPFRPERRTPIPFVAGVHTATVDGPTWGGRAEIDADGRYKVTFVNTAASSTRDKGSDYVRKASPYSGKGDTGLELPLLPGTEVLIAYLNGDIDYPLILGAVPNADTASVVRQSNQQYNRLRTPSGVVLEMFDGPAPPATP